ncbi:hypothetical protein [Bernardetia sp. MNP-M8]|uniref:hypothetical protein n=1 Tax=Bernardetia sp. MNP-M8 TaxID=3127470 RepID=UPI0030CFD24F
MIQKNAFTFSLLFISSLLLLSSCRKKDADRKKELNEILTIVREFKHVKYVEICSLNKYTGKYTIAYDSLYSFTQDEVCINCKKKTFDKIILKVEGTQNLSSKLYFIDFVQAVYYEKQEDWLRVWFHKFPFFEKNEKGVDFKEGKWREFILENDEIIYLE